MARQLVVQGVQFVEDGVLVTYMQPPTDVRNRELLVLSHQLLVVRGGKDGYGDELDDLYEACQNFLADKLEDFLTSTDVGIHPPPARAEPAADDDDDEEDANYKQFESGPMQSWDGH